MRLTRPRGIFPTSCRFARYSAEIVSARTNRVADGTETEWIGPLLAHTRVRGFASAPPANSRLPFVEPDVLHRPSNIPDSDRLEVALAALDAVGDLVCVVTTAQLEPPGPEIVYVNETFERVTGYSPSEILGQTPRVLQGPKTERRTLDEMRRALVDGRPFQGKTTNYRKDGTEYTVEWNVVPILSVDGTPKYYLSIQRDLTESERSKRVADEQSARVRAIVDAAVDAIITIDERGTIESANRACQTLFGYDPEELVGRNVNCLMPSPVAEEHDDYLRAYLQTGERKIIGIGRNVDAHRKDGTVFPVSLAVSELRLGDRRFFTGIIRDRTREREIESELLRQRSLARLGEISAVVAHEIRNPLTGIVGVLRVLEGRSSSKADREIIGETIDRVLALNASVDDILTFAKPKMPVTRSVPVDVLIEETVSLARSDAEFSGIEFSVSAERVSVECDPEMIRSVLLNLFVNARQAMDGSGTITVTTQKRSNDPDGLDIAVQDTGRGFSEAARTSAFEPFFTTKGAGTGLGLPIAKRIAELHRGSVRIENAPAGGAVVTLSLPMVTG